MLDSFAVSPVSTVINIDYRNTLAVTEPNFIFRKCFGRKLIPLQCKTKRLVFCRHLFAIPLMFLLLHSAIGITLSIAVSVAALSDQRSSSHGTLVTKEAHISNP